MIKSSFTFILFVCLGLLLVACPASPAPSPNPTDPTDPNNPAPPIPGAENTLLHEGSQYPIDNGMIYFGSKEGNHVATTLKIADGIFLPTTVYYGDIPVTTWSPESGEANMTVKLQTMGDSFEAGTYTFVAPVGEGPILPNPQGKNYIEGGTMRLDVDGSGTATKDERFDIIGGRILITSEEGGMTLVFDLTLSDGSQVVGSYNRSFIDPDNLARPYPGPGTPPPAPPQDGEICTYLIRDEIEEPTVLKDTPAACDYLLGGFVTVSSKLTIEPGVVIRATEKAFLNVEKGEGIDKGELDIVGTPDKRIVFEGEKSLKGYWRGLELEDIQESRLHYVDIRDTGYECRYCNKAALSLENTPVSLQNVTVSNGLLTGLYVDKDSQLLEFSSNRFFANDGAGLSLESAETLTQLDTESDYSGSDKPNGLPYIRVSNAELEDDTSRRWKGLNAPYFFRYSVDVQAGSLALDPGVDIIVSGAEFKIDANAQLSAQGTASAPITFRGENDEQKDWEGVYLYGSLGNTLKHVNIKNAEWGVYLEDEASLSLSDSFIQAEYGVACDIGYFKTDKNTLELGPNNRFETVQFDVDPDCELLTP